ncbi:hypothetical protein [Desulfospira joergensenii]|uniref:hypothetical protein n=1 Tax=Desulfospira joergensenii TaxID=53329 RepID=UPI0003B705D5|nr:hypothetical protein [Desulfospira joergensenii]
MNVSVKIILTWLFTILLMMGCVAGEKQAKKMSPDEKAINMALDKMVKARFVDRDLETYMSFWHENAKVSRGSGKDFMSKQEYKANVAKSIAEGDKLILVSKKITVNGTNAVAKTKYKFNGKGPYPWQFDFVKHNGIWLILSDKW